MDSKLKSTLSWAITHVPYYREIAKALDPNFLSSFPIVSKDIYLSQTNDFLSDSIDTSTLKIFATSGTTGMPLKIAKTSADYYTQLKNLWMARSTMYGIKPYCKYINIAILNNHSEISYLSANGKCLNINSSMITTEWLMGIKEEIIEFQPEYILSYTSGLMKLLSLYEALSLKLPPSIKIIELIGEPLLRLQRRTIENFTAAKIIQNYSATEALGIALSCPYGNLHCINENAIIEVFDGNRKCEYDEEGEFAITSLHSKAMPFIRYKIGDIGKITKGNSCPCECQGDIVQITKGRTSDFIELNNGKSLHSITIFSIIEDTSFLLKNCIFSFKIVQLTSQTIEIYLCFKEGYERFFNIFQEVFRKKISLIIDDEINWVFRTYSYIDLKNDGKEKLFVRKSEKNNFR